MMFLFAVDSTTPGYLPFILVNSIYEGSNAVNLSVVDDSASSAITLPTTFRFGDSDCSTAFVSTYTLMYINYVIVHLSRLVPMDTSHLAHQHSLSIVTLHFREPQDSILLLHFGTTSTLEMVAS